MKEHLYRIDAAAIADGDGLFAAPGSLLLAHPIPPVASLPAESVPAPLGFSLLAAGHTADVSRHPASPLATVISRPDAVLIPGLVNAHTHLDLTHIGPRPFKPANHTHDGFAAWIDMIRRERLHEPDAIARSVRLGISLSLAGGTVAVGDIAGAPRGIPSLVPAQTLQQSPLAGVSFLEFFSRGLYRDNGLSAGLNALDVALNAPTNHAHLRIGLQPHAPNTVAASSYLLATQHAANRQAPLCTHLAESPEEREFIAHATGPQRSLLESLGLWDDSAAADIGIGLHPVEFLAPTLLAAHAAGTPYLVAHMNDAPDSAIDLLAQTATRVAYCPRASAYFRANLHFGPHRYRDMLDAGVLVCLGTDSIVNLPPDTNNPATGGISVWHEVETLYRRDRTNPFTLLRMATVHGALALGVDPASVSFTRATSDLNHLPNITSQHFVAGCVAIRPVQMPDLTADPTSFLGDLMALSSCVELLQPRNIFS